MKQDPRIERLMRKRRAELSSCPRAFPELEEWMKTEDYVRAYERTNRLRYSAAPFKVEDLVKRH